VAERCPLPPPPVSAYSSLRALQFRSVPIGLNMVDHLSHVFSNRVQREKVKHYGLVDGAGLNYTKPMPCIEPDFLVKPAQSTTLSLPWTTRVMHVRLITLSSWWTAHARARPIDG
jgi:hypothetical protein